MVEGSEDRPSFNTQVVSEQIDLEEMEDDCTYLHRNRTSEHSTNFFEGSMNLKMKFVASFSF